MGSDSYMSRLRNVHTFGNVQVGTKAHKVASWSSLQQFTNVRGYMTKQLNLKTCIEIARRRRYWNSRKGQRNHRRALRIACAYEMENHTTKSGGSAINYKVLYLRKSEGSLDVYLY
jgi:hypothetical protein